MNYDQQRSESVPARARPPGDGEAGARPWWTRFAPDVEPWNYLPGVLAGLVGCGVFLVLHALWILPIWFVAPVGVVVAGLGGALVDVAFRTVEPRLPAGLFGRSLALCVGSVLVLVPTVALVQVGAPYLPTVDGAVRTAAVDVPAVALRFVVEFLLVTALAGAGVGWLLTRRRRGALAVAAGAVAIALGPGHNLPFFQVAVHPGPTLTAYLLTLVPLVVASVVLVVVDGRYGPTHATPHG
ncbi:hypothetical protein [Halomarina rubra]|uniref:Uncharacterized protein n=1 Tax=Halomarina rubra TaxID=2071873 RepID=A0ABD6AXD5_9EURY|nr:hypothetical protein [Halomarina rubra]